MECQCCCQEDDIIICPSCSYETCRACVEKYWKEKNDMTCMKCQSMWDVDFIDEHLPMYRSSEIYRIRRTELLFMREKSRLPEAMVRLAVMKKKQDIRDEISSLEAQLVVLRQRLTDLDTRTSLHVSRPCGKCNGYQDACGVCIMCNTSYCTDCQEEHHERDQCDAQKRANCVVIEQTTRPCPKCRVPIQKSDGCYQMWCTQCRTGFDWTRGTLINSRRLHNPHFFQAQIHSLEWNKISDKFYSCPRDLHHLWKSLCLFLETIDTDARSFLSTCTDDTEQWRVDYLCGRLSDDDWKTHLFLHDQQVLHRHVFITIIDGFKSEGVRIVRKIVDSGGDIEYHTWQAWTHKMLMCLKKTNDRLIHLNDGKTVFPVVSRFRLKLPSSFKT